MIVNFYDKNITYAPSYDEALEKGRCKNRITYSRDYRPGRVNLITDEVIEQTAKTTFLKGQVNVAWIMEPIDYIRHVYETIFKDCSKFDLIMTHNLQLLEAAHNAVYIPAMATLIDTASMNKRHDKKLVCSMIYSDKKSLPGHMLRYSVVDKIRSTTNCVDFFGSGTGTRIEKKTEGLNDYCFSISIENSRSRGYFTEKLLDCFATRTVPIYWGDDYAWEIFDKSGAITFDSVHEIPEILSCLSFEKYKAMLEAVERNWETCCRNYYSMDSWVLKNMTDNLSLQKRGAF